MGNPDKTAQAIAYYRTSSAANVGPDKDSASRQTEAVHLYAQLLGYRITAEFYDAAVSGADPIDQRPGFAALLREITESGVRTVLVESADRFARDLAVQIAGHDLLKRLGVELVPVTAPEYFRDETPTAVLVRQVLGAIAQFERAQMVCRLKGARDRQSHCLGRRIEGRKSYLERDPLMVREARRLARRNPKTGEKRSLRAIARELAALGYHRANGEPFFAASVQSMLIPRKTRGAA